jgi:2-amino-4-hydroxy-6-hydroxymethyldihydropteridine diphosphokinase
MNKVYIGIGSNMGRRLKNCRDALWNLQASGVFVEKVSSPMKYEAGEGEGQPDSINMVARILTKMSPRELLQAIKGVELRMGRKPDQERSGPRPIDMDILLYGDRVINEEGLIIPHPLMHKRTFVLGPMMEIEPDVVHPVFGKTIKELAHELRARLQASGQEQTGSP